MQQPKSQPAGPGLPATGPQWPQPLACADKTQVPTIHVCAHKMMPPGLSLFTCRWSAVATATPVPPNASISKWSAGKQATINSKRH